MSSLNVVKGVFNNAVTNMQPYKAQLQLGLFVVVAVLLIYVIFMLVVPPADVYQQVILSDARKGSELQGAQFQIEPPMRSGGEYTFQTWLFIENYDYRAGQPKHVFTITSDGPPGGGRPPHVAMMGVLYPTENKMMIRVYQGAPVDKDNAGMASSPSQPDLTVLKNFKTLFQGQGTELGLKGTLDYPLCDIQNLPLQKWICLAIVMNGRVMDVYMDGKLARSCVLPGIPIVEKGNNVISLGMMGGWAGALSTTRFYGYALTPDVIYNLYQEGPDVGRGLNNKFGFAGFLGERLGLRVDYSGL
jgi:hypothetical protein